MRNEVVLKHARAWLIIRLLIGIILAPLGIGILIVIWSLLRYFTESLTLHPNSIIVKRGVLSRNANEIPTSKINNINTYRSLLGIMVGYGNIGIYSANASEPEVFKDIAHPEKVKNAIKARMENRDQSLKLALEAEPIHK